MHATLLSDMELAGKGYEQSWCSLMNKAYAEVYHSPNFNRHQHILNAFKTLQPLDSDKVLTQLLTHYSSKMLSYQGQDFSTARLDPTCSHPLMTYATCFSPPSVTRPTDRPPLPTYLHSNQRYQTRNLSRFRLGSHQLRVTTGRYSAPFTPWSQRKCQRCTALPPFPAQLMTRPI